MKKTRPILLAMSLLVMASLACSATLPLREAVQSLTGSTPELVEVTQPEIENEAPTIAISNDLISQQDALISLYQSVSPGVVSIFVAGDQGSGQGSGFVIDNEGHIVTNYHVIEGASYIEIAFSSGTKVVADIAGIDTDSDLAVLQVDLPADQLTPLALGDSSELQVGQMVVAIGNPFGLSGSMSTGIVSSLGRSLDGLNESPEGQFFTAGDLIQTDAAINPGNSGGPLLNLNGEVIGVNRAIRTFSTNVTGENLNSGIGFAVSVNIVKRVAPALIAGEHYDYPYLGISSISDLTLAQAEQLGLSRSDGVYVSDVVANGPSDQAGLEVGDMILSVDGSVVHNFSAMISYLFNEAAPGDTVTLHVLRGTEEFDLELTLGARP